MGNEQTNEENVNLVKNNFGGAESSLGYFDNVSSYKGMKTETTEKHTNNSNSDLSEKTTEQTVEIDDSKIPYTFVWDEGGDKVLLTGTFTNWQQSFAMSKGDNGTFTTQITLPKQFYQFKFIVDGNWKCSRRYDKMDDGSYNINNFIDLSKIETPLTQPPPSQKPQGENQNNNKNNNNSKAHSTNSKEKDGYGLVYPEKKELNTDAPLTPLHYINPFRVNCNTNQNIIGRNKFLEFLGNYNIDENNCYRQIMNTPHVNLNHLITRNSARKTYVKVGGSLRYKQKVVTIIYYKPI